LSAATTNSAAIPTGQFPFFDFARQFDVWQCSPLDQGGRLVQLDLIGSEKDDDIVKAVRHPNFFVSMGDPGRWNSLQPKTPELACWLNRWYVLPSFARLFYVSGDRKYLDDLLGLIRPWAKANPSPVDASAYFKTKVLCWRDMQVAWRTRNLAWCYFLGHDGFTDAERAELYGMIGDNARLLHEYFGAEPLGMNNHQSHAASAMLYAGLLFPDLPAAQVLHDDGIRVLEHHIEHAFYPDGNSVELVPGYYPFFASVFRDSLMLCQANKVPVPRGCQDRVRQCRDYIRWVAQPDGTMPPINDSSQTDPTSLLKTLDAVLDSKPAEIASHYFDSSGQAVMRDTDQYLFADAGPLILFHWHGGKMGFHCWGNGEPFIVDSGECNYDRPNREGWYCTPPAHNSLLIDDDGDYDRKKLKMDGRMSADCKMVDWQSTPKFDSVTMIHNGFAKRTGMIWVRSISMIKSGFTLVVDQIFGPEPRSIALPFHFAPGQVELPDASTCRWQGKGCTGELIVADDSAFDDQHTLAGLVSCRSRDTPATIVTFSARRASVRNAFLLATYPRGNAPDLSVKQKINNGQIEIEARRRKTISHLRLPAFTTEMIAKMPSKIDLSIEIEIG
jgi:hypothetical protein